MGERALSGLRRGAAVRLRARSVVVDGLIAEGAYAYVYLVHAAEAPHTRFALKRLWAPARESPDLHARVEREIRVMLAARRTRGPGADRLCALVDHHWDGPECFLLLEYCAGGGVLEHLAQIARSDRRVRAVFADVVVGVAHLHSLEPPVVHLDLKIENVLVAPDEGSGRTLYKICDFGSAILGPLATRTRAEKAHAEELVQTTTTLAYRAPEMIDLFDTEEIGPPADVWALGCLLFALWFAGETPFGEEPLAILNAALQFPDGRRPAAPFAAIIERTLVPRPRDRPDVFVVARALEGDAGDAEAVLSAAAAGGGRGGGGGSTTAAAVDSAAVKTVATAAVARTSPVSPDLLDFSPSSAASAAAPAAPGAAPAAALSPAAIASLLAPSGPLNGDWAAALVAGVCASRDCRAAAAALADPALDLAPPVSALKLLVVVHMLVLATRDAACAPAERLRALYSAWAARPGRAASVVSAYSQLLGERIHAARARASDDDVERAVRLVDAAVRVGNLFLSAEDPQHLQWALLPPARECAAAAPPLRRAGRVQSLQSAERFLSSLSLRFPGLAAEVAREPQYQQQRPGHRRTVSTSAGAAAGGGARSLLLDFGCPLSARPASASASWAPPPTGVPAVSPRTPPFPPTPLPSSASFVPPPSAGPAAASAASLLFDSQPPVSAPAPWQPHHRRVQSASQQEKGAGDLLSFGAASISPAGVDATAPLPASPPPPAPLAHPQMSPSFQPSAGQAACALTAKDLFR